MLLLAIWGTFFLVTYKQVIRHDFYYYNPVTLPNDPTTVYVNASTARVVYKYTSDPNAPHVMFDFYQRYNALSLNHKSYVVSYDNSSAPLTFNITRLGSDWDAGYDDTMVIVWLRSDSYYHLYAIATSGWAEIRAQDQGMFPPTHQVIVGNIFISTTSGLAKFVAYDGARINGSLQISTQSGRVLFHGEDAYFDTPIEVQTNTGSTEIKFFNATLKDNLSFNSKGGNHRFWVRDIQLIDRIGWQISSGSGAINYELEQQVSPVNPLDLNITTTTAPITVTYAQKQDATACKITGLSEGKVELTAKDAFFGTPDENTLSSSNFQQPVTAFNILLKSDSGKINAQASSL